MMPPSERSIALFLSRTSSTRNRALLYLGITDGNLDDAVALFNCKPDESFRAALSRSAAPFRRPLANGAKGYEDKYGVIHLQKNTDDEHEKEVELVGASKCAFDQGGFQEYGENPRWGRDVRKTIHEPKVIRPTIKRSASGGSRRSVIYEHEERGHRGRYARELGVPGFRPLRGEGDTKPISARTRTSLKQAARLSKLGQGSCLRTTMPRARSPKKRVLDVTPPTTPCSRKSNPIVPVTSTRRRARRQSSEEYEPYVTPPTTAKSRFKQARKNTSGIANTRTPRACVSRPSNTFGVDSYPTPLSVSSSRLKTERITFNASDPQHPSEEILHSKFHRSTFDSMSPLAMKSDYYNKSKTPRHRRDTSEIPLQDLYLAPPSPVSKFSFLSALSLAREKKKWLLINIQSATVPVCRILNREIWRNPEIADIVGQSFIFLQLNHNDKRADAYFRKFYDSILALDEKGEGIVLNGAGGSNNRKFIQVPHIALLDPVLEHRWEVWNGPSLPDKDRFLADLSEYEMVGEGGWCEWGKGVIREKD